MKNNITLSTVRTIIVATIAVVAILTLTSLSASAAPGGDYFTSVEQTSDSSDEGFVAWLEEQSSESPQLCDAYNTIFPDGKDCVAGNTSGEYTDNIAGVAGALMESRSESGESAAATTPKITLDGQRCVQEDGVVELIFNNVYTHILLRDGDVYAVSSGDGRAVDYKTFANLHDGDYELTGFNAGQRDQVSFSVDCNKEDEPEGPAAVTASCSVTPKAPETGETVGWQVSADGGDGNFNYNWTGDVSGNRSYVESAYEETGEKVGFATVTSGASKRTVRCSVDVQGSGGDVMGTSTDQYRTIEEF